MFGLAAVEVTVLSVNALLKKKLLIVGVRREIRDLKVELESMRSFLRVADHNKYNNNDENEAFVFWVAQVRDAAYRVEDVIDEFMYQMGNIQGGHRCFKTVFHRFVRFPKELYVKYFTATKLQRIKAEIRDIGKRSKRYDLGNCHIDEGPSSHPNPRWVQNIGESSFFVEEDDVVGNERERSMLLSLLMDGEAQRTVISVVGMGGSGKTTLVANAYNDHEVKRFFDCSAWVTISQSYVIEDLFRRLIIEFFDGKNELVPSGLSTMGYKQLAETLVQLLHRRRYVVVLDDVWTNNFWMQINVALPDGKNGSRVILTTRMEDVALYPFGVRSHVVHSQPLTEDHAWTLFCNKTFSNEPDKSCPPELEKIARDLVKKCEGLPLAIVALGGLMASKDKSELKWQEVYNGLEWHWRDNPMLEVVKTILLLSFNDLPHCLKKCFLYCCRFPEGDYWTGGGRLVRLWVAEGFVEERRGFTQEEVVKSYLKELISRSLLKVKKTSSFLRAKMCKLHDLMREIALSISEQENFSTIYDAQAVIEDEKRPRRLSLLHTVNDTPEFSPNMSQVRSFAAFNFSENSTFSLDSFLSSFRLLRVLELNDAPIDHVPEAIGKLFNLRYLNLRRARIKELPKSLGRLRNLQTLDIRETKIEELPKAIAKLRNMRHLLMYCTGRQGVFEYITGKRVPSTIWKLKNLQVLNCIEANGEIIKGIAKMTQLRRLELTNVRTEDETELCASIQNLKLLRHLLVMARNEDESLTLDALPHSSLPPVIRKLTLIGRLKKVPSWFPSLHNIIYLHLHWSQVAAEEDPIQHINALPNLEHLALVNAYGRGKEQLCFDQGFPKLQDLFIVIFPDLGEIMIGNGVMPNLQRLMLRVCGQLKKVPRGIEQLTNLEELDLKDVSMELIDSIRGEESVDYVKVKHIPMINHSYETPEGRRYESLSRT